MNFPQITLPSSELGVMIGLVGLLVLIAGTRFYKLTVMAPGFLFGALVASKYGNLLGLPPAGPVEPQVMVGLLLGGAAALAMIFLEQLAIALTGALVGGALVMFVGPMLVTVVEWYVPFIGAFIGALIFPSLYRRLLVPTTALLGAVCVGYGLGFNDNLPVIGVLWLFGSCVQWFFRRPPKSDG